MIHCLWAPLGLPMAYVHLRAGLHLSSSEQASGLACVSHQAGLGCKPARSRLGISHQRGCMWHSAAYFIQHLTSKLSSTQR